MELLQTSEISFFRSLDTKLNQQPIDMKHFAASSHSFQMDGSLIVLIGVVRDDILVIPRLSHSQYCENNLTKVLDTRKKHVNMLNVKT